MEGWESCRIGSLSRQPDEADEIRFFFDTHSPLVTFTARFEGAVRVCMSVKTVCGLSVSLGKHLQ
jgi:membrane protein DedA with SNARE-associated domain